MKVISALEICGLCLCFGVSSQAAFVASPHSAGGGTIVPFTTGTNLGPSLRYQQVYGASDFTHLGTPFLITEVRFNNARGNQYLGVTTAMRAQLDFSTTSRGPDALSSVFAENVGSDRTTVLSGVLDLHSEDGGDFSLHVPLQAPFLYDPSLGNLLFDVRVFQTVDQNFGMIPPGYPTLTAATRLGDTVSSVFTFDVGAETARFTETVGLLTSFQVTPVPEPGVLTMLIIGVGSLAVWRQACRRIPRRVAV